MRSRSTPRQKGLRGVQHRDGSWTRRRSMGFRLKGLSQTPPHVFPARRGVAERTEFLAMLMNVAFASRFLGGSSESIGVRIYLGKAGHISSVCSATVAPLFSFGPVEFRSQWGPWPTQILSLTCVVGVCVCVCVCVFVSFWLKEKPKWSNPLWLQIPSNCGLSFLLRVLVLFFFLRATKGHQEEAHPFLWCMLLGCFRTLTCCQLMGFPYETTKSESL